MFNWPLQDKGMLRVKHQSTWGNGPPMRPVMAAGAARAKAATTGIPSDNDINHRRQNSIPGPGIDEHMRLER